VLHIAHVKNRLARAECFLNRFLVLGVNRYCGGVLVVDGVANPHHAMVMRYAARTARGR